MITPNISTNINLGYEKIYNILIQKTFSESDILFLRNNLQISRNIFLNNINKIGAFWNINSIQIEKIYNQLKSVDNSANLSLNMSTESGTNQIVCDGVYKLVNQGNDSITGQVLGGLFSLVALLSGCIVVN